MLRNYACSLSLVPGKHHTAMIWQTEWSPCGNKFLTQSEDGTVKVWDARSGELLLTAITRREVGGRLCRFSPNGDFLCTSTERNKLTLLRASDGTTVATSSQLEAPGPVAACFAPDSKQIAVSYARKVCTLEVPTLKPTGILLPVGAGDSGTAAISLAFAGNGASLVCMSGSWLQVWDVQTRQLRHNLRENNWGFDVSPCGKLVAVGCQPGWGRVGVWDVSTGIRLLELPPNASDNDHGRRARWHPSERKLFVCSADGHIRSYSFSPDDPGSSGQVQDSMYVFRGRPSQDSGNRTVSDFAVSPCGLLLAFCGGDQGNVRSSRNLFVEIFRAPELPQPSPLGRQLGDLLRSKRGADVTLACAGGAEMQAHSLILALRSGTLQRQLDWGAEREGGAPAASGSSSAPAGVTATGRRLEIEGAVEPAILEKMLEYTDHLVIQSAEEAQHLLFAASFYDVPGLFQLCLPVLEERLSVENVAGTLIAADKYSERAVGVKLAAFRFVKEHGAAIVRSPAWRRVPSRLKDDLLYFNSTGELPPAAAAEGEEGEEGEQAPGGE